MTHVARCCLPIIQSARNQPEGGGERERAERRGADKKKEARSTSTLVLSVVRSVTDVRREEAGITSGT